MAMLFRRGQKIHTFAVITALLLFVGSCANDAVTPETDLPPSGGFPSLSADLSSPVTTPDPSLNPLPDWYGAYCEAVMNYDYGSNIYGETSVTLCDVGYDGAPVLWFHEIYEWGNLSKAYCFIGGEVVSLFEENSINLFQNTATGETAFYAALDGDGWGDCTFWLPYVYRWDGSAFVPLFTNEPAQGYEDFCDQNGLWVTLSSDELETSWEFATKEQYAEFLRFADGKLIGTRHNSDGTRTQLSISQYYEEAAAYLSGLEKAGLYRIDMKWIHRDSGIELLTTENEVKGLFNAFIAKVKIYKTE